MHPSERFDGLARTYRRSRPSYPPEFLDFLRSELGLRPEHLVADIGAGTGILTRILLDAGNRVLAVEPGEAMGAIAGEDLARYGDRFTLIRATAEETTLPAASIDLITVGQAFHWFDGPAARREFGRILRPGGFVVLVWNARRVEGTPFMVAYEDLLLRHGTDYLQVSHRWAHPGALEAFFAPRGYRRVSFPNHQDVDLDGLVGRIFSSSYTPPPGHPDHEPMLDAVRGMFREHQHGGLVRIEYDTDIYFGSLEQPPRPD